MSAVARFFQRNWDVVERMRLYRFLGTLFFFLALACVWLKGDLNFVVSDGRGYYVYLPSLFVDHDLDFSNQIMQHWGVDFDSNLLSDKTDRGYVKNKYPIGLALTISPAFSVAHILSMSLFSLTGCKFFFPDGYSVLYQLAALFFIMFLGYLMMLMIDKILHQMFKLDGSVILLSILCFWGGSHYAYYYFREPVMVHVVSAFWITTTIFLSLLWQDKNFFSEKKWAPLFSFFLVIFSFSMTIICRPTNVFIFFCLAPVLLRKIPGLVREKKILSYVLVSVMALFPVLIQMSVWKTMSGKWLYYSYESAGFKYWQNPFLFSTLFSSLHGLFFWAPALFFSVVGIFIRLKQKTFFENYFLISFLIGAIFLWYLNSSWHQWWFGDAFGGRSFIELAALFIMGFAFFFEFIFQQAKKWQISVLILLALCVVYTYALMACYISHKIPRADYLF